VSPEARNPIPDPLRQRWRVEQDDEIGGWCVVLDVPGTPATGNRPIMSFVSEVVARYVVMLHHKVLGPDLGALGRVMAENAAAFGRAVRLNIYDRGTGEVTRIEAGPPGVRLDADTTAGNINDIGPRDGITRRGSDRGRRGDRPPADDDEGTDDR
jgi:hypothetical protein